jgi:hypothetical protein
MCHREAPPSMGYVKGGDRNRVAFDGLAECSGASVTKHMPEGRATEKRAVSRREGVDYWVSLFDLSWQSCPCALCRGRSRPVAIGRAMGVGLCNGLKDRNVVAVNIELQSKSVFVRGCHGFRRIYTSGPQQCA